MLKASRNTIQHGVFGGLVEDWFPETIGQYRFGVQLKQTRQPISVGGSLRVASDDDAELSPPEVV